MDQSTQVVMGSKALILGQALLEGIPIKVRALAAAECTEASDSSVD